MPFEIAPLALVKKDYPEFRQAMADLESRVRAVAESIWPGYSFGGLLPGPQQYGLANIRPRQTKNPGVTHLLGSNSWLKSFSAPGSDTNIFSYTVPNDLVHGFAGFAFPDPHLIFNDLQLKITDITYPRIEIEEARIYSASGGAGGFALILKPDKQKEFVVPEKASFLMTGYQERNTSGLSQRVIPIGLAAYRDRTLFQAQGAN